jgi:hypothetical protein
MASAGEVTVTVRVDISQVEAEFYRLRHAYPEWFLTAIGDVLPPRYTFARAILIGKVRLARSLRRFQ